MNKCWCGRNHIKDHWTWIFYWIRSALECDYCEGWGTREEELPCENCLNTCLIPIPLTEL